MKRNETCLKCHNMSLVVKRKSKENNSRLVHRFNKEVRKGKIVDEARERRFHQKPISEQMKKKSTLKKIELREKYKRMEKLGQL